MLGEKLKKRKVIVIIQFFDLEENNYFDLFFLYCSRLYSMRLHIVSGGIAAALISLTFSGSFAGCGLEECLEVGSDDSDDNFIACASRSFDEEEMARVDPEYLRDNLRRFAAKLKAMKEEEEQVKGMITNKVLDELRHESGVKNTKLSIDKGATTAQDSPATTNESTVSDRSPSNCEFPLERKLSQPIAITPTRNRAATDSLVDLRDEKRMAYSFVPESPRTALSQKALAHFEEYLKSRNPFVAPEVKVERSDDGVEDGVESNQHTIDDDVEIFNMDDY